MNKSCRNCKYFTTYHGLDDIGEPTEKLVYYCEHLLIDIWKLDNYCDNYEKNIE